MPALARSSKSIVVSLLVLRKPYDPCYTSPMLFLRIAPLLLIPLTCIGLALLAYLLLG